jgi:arylsulfatase A-like enzyme
LFTARHERGRGIGRGIGKAAVLASAAALGALALAEIGAHADAPARLGLRVGLLVGLLYLGLAAGIAGVAALVATLARWAGSRLSAVDAVAALLLGIGGSAKLAPYVLPRLGARLPALGGGAGFWALAGGLAVVYVVLRAVLWRGPGGDRAGLVSVTALLALAAAASAAVRGAGRTGELSSVRLAIPVAFALLATAAALLTARLGAARLLGAVAVVALAVVGQRLWIGNPHGWMQGAPPPRAAPPPGAPPVIFIVLDTFRADALQLDPGGRTPSLARLAAHADVFPDVIANASWTLPGHASLFTGLLLAHHRTDQTDEPGFSSRLAPGIPTLHQLLGRRGYRTTCITANGIVGLTSGLARGCQRYRNPGRIWLMALLPWEVLDHTLASVTGFTDLVLDFGGVNVNAEAREIVDDALGALPEDPTGQYLFLNFLDVHGPLRPRGDVSPSARRRLDLDTLRLMLGLLDQSGWWERNRLTLRADYDAQTRSLDAELGRLFDALERRGWLGPAALVVASDHGEGFDENPGRVGYFGHHSAFEPSVRVPLLVKRPGQEVPSRRAGPVQQIDVLPTLLAAVGLPAPPVLDGASLLDGAPRHRPITEWYARRGAGDFPFFPYDRQAIYEGRFKFVREGDGRISLFDLAASPYETEDVTSAHPELSARLAAALDQALRASGPSERAPGADPALDEQLRALGYAE